eukprot:CAMPEP_0118973320 /NCGR_PEP_ID=MMETSP1173-20130426/9802_1 /TAXON_ID=1034831 /ORGANISM="Rhizochromulina marina cf, Strain CCMP1243" /LENGTH=153 /DNA_ID=CAMNT_0006922951 /DNA_START=39 /DNA_END=500 /DNA_ORIENTATION=+
MNSSIRGALQHYLQAEPALTHSQSVARLYRACLKTLQTWAIDRDVFNEEATRIQQEFRSNMHCDDRTAERLIADTKKQLFDLSHPDSYIPAYMPGGSLYMRNPPLPLSVCYPDGLPEGVEPLKELNPDMTYVQPGEKVAAGRVLVDAAQKKMF